MDIITNKKGSYGHKSSNYVGNKKKIVIFRLKNHFFEIFFDWKKW